MTQHVETPTSAHRTADEARAMVRRYGARQHRSRLAAWAAAATLGGLVLAVARMTWRQRGAGAGRG